MNQAPGGVFNVTATLRGRSPRSRPFFVMTPRSGGGRCASDAAWLRSGRDIPHGRGASARGRTTVFPASTGHELGIRLRSSCAPGRASPERFAWIPWAELGMPSRCPPAAGDRTSNAGRATDASHRAGEPPPDGVRSVEAARGERPAHSRASGTYLSIIGTTGCFTTPGCLASGRRRPHRPMLGFHSDRAAVGQR